MSTSEHDRRREEVAAFALGALDAAQMDGFREHLDHCERCQDELRRLEPAVRALPEGVEQQAPPPRLKARLMEEVRADAASEGAVSAAGPSWSFIEWLRGVRIGGLTWKPLAGLAVAILVVAGGIGYAIGSGSGDNVHTIEREQPNGVVAEVVTEGGEGELRLTGLQPLPPGKVLEAWVQRGEAIEPVEALFTPDGEGNATASIEDMSDVSVVMVTREPAGGTNAPTTKPIAEVPLEGT